MGYPANMGLLSTPPQSLIAKTGDYLTDGRRLVQVVDEQKTHYVCDDCSVPLTEKPHTVRVMKTTTMNWRPVLLSAAGVRGPA